MVKINNVELVQISKNINFEFRFKEENNEQVLQEINDLFDKRVMITNENKKILPTIIYRRLDFRHGERYKIDNFYLSANFPLGYIGITLDLSLTEYWK